MKTEERRLRTKNLALASLLCAVSVVLLYIGSVFEPLDLTMTLVASLPVVLSVIEMGGMWPWLIYSVTAILGLILLPAKLPAAVYVFLFGFYSIVKEKLERRLRGILAWLCKIGIFSSSVGLLWFTIRLFLPEASFEEGILLWLLTLSLTLFLYDLLLTRLITRYVLTWRRTLRKNKHLGRPR